MSRPRRSVGELWRDSPWAFASLTAICALLLALNIWGLVELAMAEVEIDRDSVTTSARVVDVETSVRGPSRALVEFTVEGRMLRTRVYPWALQAPPPVGAEIRIEYARNRPELARRAGAHDLVSVPLAVAFPFILVAILFAVLLAIMGVPKALDWAWGKATRADRRRRGRH